MWEEMEGNELLTVVIGIVLLGVGLFLFSNQVSVSMSWYSWSFFVFGRHNLSNGIVSIPLIIGIIMLFFNHKSILAKIITTLGTIFIILTIIMGIQFRFEKTSLFVYILIIGLIAAGSGVILRVLLKKRNKQCGSFYRHSAGKMMNRMIKSARAQTGSTERIKCLILSE